MARLLWLPDVLRDAGCKINVMAGAASRGREDIVVRGVVWHSTVTKASTPDERVAELLRDGHSTLKGPLAQLGGRRDGSFDIPALGRCNHNGYGQWGNDAIGIEFYNDGYGPFTPAQIEQGSVATAAILKHLRMTETRCKAHKETDPDRKIDPPVDMNMVRAKVKAKLSNTQPPTVPQEDDVKDGIIFFAVPGGNHAYRCAGYEGIYLDGPTLDALRYVGIPFLNDPAHPWPANVRAGYRLLDGPLKNV